MAKKSKKIEGEEVNLDELTKRYMRLHNIDVKRGFGARTIEDHFQCAVLFNTTGQYKIKGLLQDKFIIPKWSSLSEKKLSEEEKELLDKKTD